MLSGNVLTFDTNLNQLIMINKTYACELNLDEINFSIKAKEFVKMLTESYTNQIRVIDSKRATLAVKNSPFLNEIDWNKIERGEQEASFKPNKVLILKLI